MIEEVQERVRQYLKTHTTESQQKFGNSMMNIFSRPHLIPTVDSEVIVVLLYALGFDTNAKAHAAYGKLIEEINERENKVYNYVDPEQLENYESK